MATTLNVHKISNLRVETAMREFPEENIAPYYITRVFAEREDGEEVYVAFFWGKGTTEKPTIEVIGNAQVFSNE